jgi:putative methionine-R-sulfoxide reductase with GAF domain
MAWTQQRTEDAMFLRRRRSHLIFSNNADNPPARDVLHAETPVDHTNLDVALKVALRAAVYGTGATGAAIALMRDGQLVCRAREGDIAPDLGVVLNADTGITGACVRSAQLLHCQDAETDGRVDSAVCRALGVRSILVVPIVVNGAVTGILEILASNDHAFNSEHIKWLTIVANFVHANTRVSERVHPEAKTVPSRVAVGQGLAEPASISGGIQSSQGPRASAEDPGLDASIGALQESSPEATWDVICEQLASGFR